MAKIKTTATKAEKNIAEPKKEITATVAVPPQYAALNVRNKPNGKIVGELKNGSAVNVLNTVTVKDEQWTQIGEKQFVKSEFLRV